jgi:calcium/calmodulin-dependent protein kinase (CaM kinase) II
LLGDGVVKDHIYQQLSLDTVVHAQRELETVTSNTVETLTKQLLDAIDNGDLETYRGLCDPSLTAFEPEALGNLVEGLGFHETYFGSPATGKRKSSVRSPNIRLLGDTAVVAYVRLVQSTTSDGQHSTTAFEETRVWHKIDGSWKNVHFHRSNVGRVELD